MWTIKRAVLFKNKEFSKRINALTHSFTPTYNTIYHGTIRKQIIKYSAKIIKLQKISREVKKNFCITQHRRNMRGHSVHTYELTAKEEHRI